MLSHSLFSRARQSIVQAAAAAPGVAHYRRLCCLLPTFSGSAVGMVFSLHALVVLAGKFCSILHRVGEAMPDAYSTRLPSDMLEPCLPGKDFLVRPQILDKFCNIQKQYAVTIDGLERLKAMLQTLSNSTNSDWVALSHEDPDALCSEYKTNIMWSIATGVVCGLTLIYSVYYLCRQCGKSTVDNIPLKTLWNELPDAERRALRDAGLSSRDVKRMTVADFREWCTRKATEARTASRDLEAPGFEL